MFPIGLVGENWAGKPRPYRISPIFLVGVRSSDPPQELKPGGIGGEDPAPTRFSQLLLSGKMGQKKPAPIRISLSPYFQGEKEASFREHPNFEKTRCQGTGRLAAYQASSGMANASAGRRSGYCLALSYAAPPIWLSRRKWDAPLPFPSSGEFGKTFLGFQISS